MGKSSVVSAAWRSTCSVPPFKEIVLCWKPSSVKDDLAIEKDSLIGRLVAGQYRIASRLGTGAMATIYRAVDEKNQREVALKIVKPEIMSNKTAAARFHREAKAASKLEHAGIVAIIAWGFDDEHPYIAMELIEGEDLFELLDRRGSLTEEQALLVVIALCDALHVAHEQGVVHRDLTPENIMVGGLEAGEATDRIHIKVLDFGIAKLVGPGGPGDMWADETVPQALTKVGSAVGTPSHMAPEQARGDQVDGRTDIYACGVLLYEMVTGHLPFEGDNPLHVAIRQVRDAPPPPTLHKPDMHPELEEIILRMLEKDPDARFQTVAELESALGEVLRDIDPDHQTAQRAIPSGMEDELQTVQREVPPELDDPDFEQRTAELRVPSSLRSMVNKQVDKGDEGSAQVEPEPPTLDDGEDPLTKVVATSASGEPVTVEMDTLQGNTLRNKMRDRLRESIAVAKTGGAAAARRGVADEPSSNDPTPFLGRGRIPRVAPKTQLSLEREDTGDRGSAPPKETGPSGTFRVNSASERVASERAASTPLATSELEHDIEDEDSEGAIATVVADPNDLSDSMAQSVLQARAIAEASRQESNKRATAMSVTKQSDFGAVVGVGGAHAVSSQVPSIEVIAADSVTNPGSELQVAVEAASRPVEGAALHGRGKRVPAHSITANLPVSEWGAGPNTRGAANELENLLRQMPRQRQPVVGSVVVLVFLGVAILALIYLLVGVATF
jgi:serine/threonine protein kinase